MKKQFLESIPFIMGAALGIFAMFLSINGNLNSTVGVEIATFSLGFVMLVICTMATWSCFNKKTS